MNAKRLILACIAVFAFVFAYEWLFHGILLKNTYIATAHLWRPEAEMMRHFGWLLLGQLVVSIVFCVIYGLRPGFKSGIGAGMAYGFLIALLLTGPTLITYAVQPLPFRLVSYWTTGGIVEMTIAGAILGAIYRPAVRTSAASAPAGPVEPPRQP